MTKRDMKDMDMPMRASRMLELMQELSDDHPEPAVYDDDGLCIVCRKDKMHCRSVHTLTERIDRAVELAK